MNNETATDATTSTANAPGAATGAALGMWESVIIRIDPQADTELEVRWRDDALLLHDVDAGERVGFVDADYHRTTAGGDSDKVCNINDGSIHGVAAYLDRLNASHANCAATPTSAIVFTQPLDSGTAVVSLPQNSPRIVDLFIRTFIETLFFFIGLAFVLFIAVPIAIRTEHFLLTRRIQKIKREIKLLKWALEVTMEQKMATMVERCMDGVPLEICEDDEEVLRITNKELRIERLLGKKRSQLRRQKMCLRGLERAARGQFTFPRFEGLLRVFR